MEIEYGVMLQLMRNRAGLTQAQAARESRINKQKLVSIELGEAKLTPSEAIRLACTYNCEIADIIYEDQKKDFYVGGGKKNAPPP